MRWWLACGLVLSALCAAVHAARPPEWVVPHLAAAAAASKRSAVMLHDYEDVRYLSEERVRRTVRGAIRVTSAQGRDRAICAYTLNPDVEKIVSAQAWIIDPMGKRAESFPTSAFADTPSQFGSHFWLQQRTVSFAGGARVEVGGVLAWEFQVESLVGVWDVGWSFEGSLPILSSVFEVTPMPGGRIEHHATGARVPAPVPGKAPGGLRWELLTTPSEDADRPDGFQPLVARVSARAVKGEGKAALGTWADFARFSAGILEGQQTMTEEVKARAEALVAGKTGRWERIRAIGEFLQRDVAYLSVSLGKDYLAGYRPHVPGDVLKNRYGDCKDKVTLMIVLLRAVGETAYPVLVSSGEPTDVRKEWPSAVFNHVIVGLPADADVPGHWPVSDAPGIGRLVMFDPTDRFTPLGLLSSGDQAGHGLVAHAKSEGLTPMPTATPEVNGYTATLVATLDAKGDLHVKAEEKMRGVRGVERQARREQQNAEQAKSALETRLRDEGLIAQKVLATEEWSDERGEHRLNLEFAALRY
ncbi:MAG TPA: transglutaminase domain-containing protein, partial [Opitutaceae bacterium]